MAQDLHWFEIQVKVNNVAYSQDQIMNISTDWLMFSEEQPTVGACLSAEIELQMIKPSVTIPRMAKIEPFVRVTDGTTTSAWMPQGVFYVDTREESRNNDNLPFISFHGYDAMLKTEEVFPDYTGTWTSKACDEVVELIADAIDVGIDDRTYDVFDTFEYSISPPVGYTMREVLSNIAAMYAGNWVMSLEGKLLLVALSDLPVETSLLVDQSGNVITFGEDAISLADTTV